ncbi:hypothetical protein AK88_01564 [Plasmodium fragile]|uniref:Inositol polyphosphate-related phosphatase domain-containing protein n=1 Tax=Plasmodium fragile TaxID=5857 RepID=A0A0D9QP47_PLAFR|nr:uncharacterized protein AK88_01564 [Plasmodium fragile]KJP88683.1 hypothetical protein AK88_01564 [Plasmodium fragile]
MDTSDSSTDTKVTIMSYNVQMLSVPLSNKLNLSTRQNAVIDYICFLDDLYDIDILVLNEVFTKNCYDVLTKGKVKDKFPYHTNVIGSKCEESGRCSTSIVQVENGARAAPGDLNRKFVITKVAPSEVATLGEATPREQETSSLNSSDTNHNDQEEEDETLNLDSSDTDNREDSGCILSFHCGLERGKKIKGKPNHHNLEAGTNSRGGHNDKEAQCSETDDEMAIQGEGQNVNLNSRDAVGADKLSDKSHTLQSTKGDSKKDGKLSIQGSYRADGNLRTRSSYCTDGNLSTISSNNAEGALTNAICDITSDAKTSISNSVRNGQNVKEQKGDDRNKKKQHNAASSFDSVSGKTKFYQILNGGVIVFSKHPIMQNHALIFSDCKFPDMFCTKGAIYLKCFVHNKPVNVIATHLQAGDTSDQQNCRWKQLNELSNWVYNGTPSFHIRKNEPLFFVGDLNIRYDLDKLFFEKVLSNGCLNSYVTKNALETTFDSYLNDYCMHMERDYSFIYKHTLDYILVSSDSDVKTLVPQTAIQKEYKPIKIIKSFLGFIPYKCIHMHHPSDHFPIYATFKIPN